MNAETELTPAAILTAGLERLRARGWGQGHANRANPHPRPSIVDGAECAGMVMARYGLAIMGPDFYFLPAYRAAFQILENVIKEQYPDDECWHSRSPNAGFTSIPFWNDAPGRTFADVEAVYEKAIQRASEVS
jgi:hypothetical protein